MFSVDFYYGLLCEKMSVDAIDTNGGIGNKTERRRSANSRSNGIILPKDYVPKYTNEEKRALDLHILQRVYSEHHQNPNMNMEELHKEIYQQVMNGEDTSLPSSIRSPPTSPRSSPRSSLKLSSSSSSSYIPNNQTPIRKSKSTGNIHRAKTLISSTTTSTSTSTTGIRKIMIV